MPNENTYIKERQSLRTEPPHVVIVGAGFGGLTAARALAHAPVRVTVVDRRNYHLFQPLLYQVATAGLSPNEIAYPIRAIVRNQPNTEVFMGEVTAIDLAEKRVLLAEGTLNFDYLILAAGARTNYHVHPEWEQFAVGMKNIDDSMAVRRRVLSAFERAEQETDPELQKQLLTFVVIGGGPTGVELSGALAELSRFALAKDFRRIKSAQARIILVEGIHRILAAFPDDLAEDCERRLKAMGVEVRTHVGVSNIDARSVQVGDEIIHASTIVWCAGVAPEPVTRTLNVKLDHAGRVIVEKDLSIPGHGNAFAIGDLCAFERDGKPLPGLAPVAIQQGQAAAACILSDIYGEKRREFHYSDHGALATIGRKAAVADLGRVRLTGTVAWLFWLAVHIMFLIGFRNKVIVILEWIWSYLTYQRGARLIIGGISSGGHVLHDDPVAQQKAEKESEAACSTG